MRREREGRRGGEKSERELRKNQNTPDPVAPLKK